ncbi:hypothetical protein M1293_00700 [Candidatus Parvarchaeota archaeon]|nr:hypothetical protein [Candidatus Parvarchaeota archaeon]
MSTRGEKAQINAGLLVIIIIVAVFVLLIVFVSAIRNFIINGLDSIGSSLVSVTKGSGGGSSFISVKTNFTAYNCTSTCTPFPQNSVYTWAIDYNGQNNTDNVSYSIQFSDVQGNYSYTAYPIFAGSSTDILCSNASASSTFSRSAYAVTGYVYLVYYAKRFC